MSSRDREKLLRLPIDDLLPEVISTLREHQGVVIEAPPGAGKSTRVPPAILDAGLAGEKAIWMLEPRRVAARATARRIAEERGVSIGDEVGYQVRFDRRIGPKTRLAVITEGILTRRIQGDPLLEGVGAVIVDEFHERSIHTDLGIAFLREVMEVREDLKVVVMSATLEAGPIAEYLGVPVLKSEGRTFPVEVEYLDRPPEDRIEVEAARAVRRHVGSKGDDGGDILVFLPGKGEIQGFLEILQPWGEEEGIELLPLYSALPSREQDRALRSGGPRKVIGATNIAETSLTIEGVTLVVDSGKVRRMKISPASGLDNLELGHISLASARQRAGRAGRVRPGRAIRLWMKAFEHRMAEYEEPEIQRVDISRPLLEVLAWSGADPREFPFFEAPPAHSLEQGVELLEGLGALDAKGFRLTNEGKRLLELPVHPRLGAILLEAELRGGAEAAAAMAAVVSERDFVSRVDSDAPTGASDLFMRAELLDEVAAGRRGRARSLGLTVHSGRARRVQKARDQLLKLIDSRGGGGEEESLRALLAGYPDRIALRREEGESRFIMVGGEPMTLAYESVVRDARWIVAPVVAGETRARDAVGGVDARSLIRMASAVEESWLREAFPGRFEKGVRVEFDPERERVMAREVETFDGISISERVVSVEEEADGGKVSDLLAEHALADLGSAFGLEKDERAFLIRWELGRRYFPEAEFPKLLDSENQASQEEPIWRQLLWGKRSFGELRKMNLRGLLSAYLTSEQRRILEEEFPERLEVPSGSRIRLVYSLEEPPVLAVRIQEVFGWATTPTLAAGRVKVLMHLLAPNYRPAQVTDDLGGFWVRTYPEVRKELRARYSKHPWPEDPLNARAVYK